MDEMIGGDDSPDTGAIEVQGTDRPTGYLESLDRSGRVTARIAVDRLPVHIGRAYTNDLIVDDPFVDAVHVRVERDTGERIWVVDLASTNGLYLRSGRTRLDSATLDDSAEVRIGHTFIRYRPLTWQVPPTRADRGGNDLLRIFEVGWSQAGLILLALALVLITAVLSRASRPEVMELVFILTGAASLVLVWAGFWSLLNRLLQHRMNFLVHVSIASSAVALSTAKDSFVGYLTFLLDWDESYVWMVGGLGVLVLAVVLYWHLRFCTISRPTTLARTLGAITVTLFLLVGLQQLMQDYGFSATPRYRVTFKPLPLHLHGPVPLKGFIDQAGALRRDLEAQQVNDN
jgi:pSer/pThr/pTyr-binding forkhead associated (FHA) protein